MLHLPTYCWMRNQTLKVVLLIPEANSNRLTQRINYVKKLWMFFSCLKKTPNFDAILSIIESWIMLIISKFWFDLNCVDCFQVLIWFELCWLFPHVEFFQTLLFNPMFSITLKCVDCFRGLNSFDYIHTNIFPFSKSI